MSDHQRLSVPPELQHLIEKRELEDRREDQRRSDTDQRQCDLGPSSVADAVDERESPAIEDQRTGEDRRRQQERRQKARRLEDN
jgi:hypothetical protein